jgi:hypothetical protein
LSLKVEEPTSWLQQLSIAKSGANPNLFTRDAPVEYIIRVCLYIAKIPQLDIGSQRWETTI